MSVEVLFVGVGIVFAYWLDFGLSFVRGPVSWRLPIAVQMHFALVVVFLIAVLPESPRWLYAKGREGEAIEVLCAVCDKESADEVVVTEGNAICIAIEMEAHYERRSFINLFKRDTLQTGRRVILAWVIQFMNQAGGINLIVYYAPSESFTFLHFPTHLERRS